ncbi:hypothetical protein Sste5346_008516 [Sporothrix stenoceras]|uniref:Uncharacterized protein n=1 Tax=Sporothrix stenoceras TaxID=5173 RepID=A0ABR3YNZ2_9PEZI
MAPTSISLRAPPSIWERAATIVARQTGNSVSTSTDGFDYDTSTPEGAHLAAIIVPSILGAILLAGGAYYTYRHFIRKRRTTKDYFERIRNGLFYTVMLTIGLPIFLGFMAFSGIKGWRDRRRDRIAFERAGTDTVTQPSSGTRAPETTVSADFAVTTVEMTDNNAKAATPATSSYNTATSYSTPGSYNAYMAARSNGPQPEEARVPTPPPSYEKSSSGKM